MKFKKLFTTFSIFPFNLLFIILVLSFVLRIYNLSYNSPFLDEAQYIVLGEKVLKGQWQEYAPFSWVGGMPLLYPPLSALFAAFGFIGSRFLNVLLGTLSVYLMYGFVKNLLLTHDERDNKIIGLVAACFLAVLVIPLYLSRLAIYDMLSFSLFLLGFTILLQAIQLKQPDSWQRENRFFIAATAFVFAFLAKYIVLILVPFVVLFGVWYVRKLDKDQLSLFGKYFVIPLIGSIGAYILWQSEALIHFQTEQIRATENQTFAIIRNFVKYSSIVLIPAFIGIVLLFIKKQRLLPFILLSFALITPLVHVVTNNVASSVQHTYLTIMFLLPLAAYCFLPVIKKWPRVGSALVISIIIGSFGYSYPQLQALENEWPNTNAVMSFLKDSTTNHEKVLSSQDDVTILALPNLTEKNITGIYTFEYKDKTGTEAYRKALNEGYFDFVLLNDHVHQEVEQVAREALTSHYQSVYSQSSFVLYKLNKN